MALTAPSTAVAAFDKGRLAAGISASDTTITVGPIYKTVNGVRTKQGFDSTSGECIISQGDYQERISFEGSSVNATTKVTSLTTCTRGLPVTNTTANFTGGTGRAWAKGAYITVVDSASYNQSTPFKNVANTFTDHQTLDTTKELRFNSSATAVWKDGSNNLSFKDAANGTKTLTQLAAAGGADEKAKVSSNDTTQGYLNGKLVAGAGITLTENNDAGNETLSVIATNSVATGHTGLSTITSGAILTGNGTGNVVPVGPGTSLQIPVSNGSTLAMTSGYTDWLNVMKNTTLDSYSLSASETYALQASYTVPATMAAGTTFRFRYHGTYNMNATGSFIKFNLGSTTVNIQDSANDVADNAYFIEGYWTCVSTGGSGSFIYHITSRFRGTTTTTASTTATTIDTTTTNLFKITVVGGGGGSAPIIKNSFAILDRLN